MFGRGSISDLSKRMEGIGSKPLVVTGHRFAASTGLFARVESMFPTVVQFGVSENPDDRACDEGAALCRKMRCDSVIGLGGGSAMDAAKAIAGLARHTGPCAHFFGSDRLPNGALPIIAIPTTAGTGSEVTPYSVITNTIENTKRSISARCLFPQVAILDPELTMTLPASVTAHTGLDALSQAMEGFVSRKSTRLGDSQALEACQLVLANLPRACAEPTDIEARTNLMYAAMLSGCVIAQSGTTLVHGMGYAFTVTSGVPHGLANALLLAPIFRFNAQTDPERLTVLAAAMGIDSDEAAKDLPAAFTRVLHDVIRACGLSPAGKDHGIAQGDLAGFTEQIVDDPYRFRNQIGLVSPREVQRFYEEAFEGA